MINIIWFRRDLRLEDNHALYQALKSGTPVLPIFIFDTDITDKLNNKHDARLNFIALILSEIKARLEGMGSSLLVLHGKPVEVFSKLMYDYSIANVYCNTDYEPYATSRDLQIKQVLESQGIKFHTFKDQVIFEKNEICKSDGLPYTVFTPYASKWKQSLNQTHLSNFDSKPYFNYFYKTEAFRTLNLYDIGFQALEIDFPPLEINKEIISSLHPK